uniref:Potassium channel domain-containing protein n=1 Tax=Trichuris muris TaxID=70415 RepID=A0A5S6QNJ7_TRIMR
MAIWPRRSTHFELETSRQLQQLFDTSVQGTTKTRWSKHHGRLTANSCAHRSGRRCRMHDRRSKPKGADSFTRKRAIAACRQDELMEFMDSQNEWNGLKRTETGICMDDESALGKRPFESVADAPLPSSPVSSYRNGSDDEDDDNLSTSTVPWKRGLQLILPHVGLVLITTIYTMIGAAIFHRIELPHERKMKRASLDDIYERRFEMIRQLWHMAREEAVDLETFEEYALLSMTNVTELLYHSFHKYYLTSHEIIENKTIDEWSFSTAIFFAVTVVTTIGFGNPAPATLTGRAVCICFALFGIPLTLVTIADIGKFFSEYLVWQYTYYLDFKQKINKGFRRWKKRHLGELSHQENFGLCDQCKRKRLLEFDHSSVPATVVIAILFGYTALGGLLFCNTEMWNYFEAFYFSFITMTTIGFGDLIPRRGSNMIGILMYIVLGLVITTMCIDLVGVQYIRKIHYFGRKIQDARSALAIVGGKVVYVGEWYNQVMAKYRNDRYRNGYVYHNVYITKHMIPFIPRDIRKIRYIDWSSESLSSIESAYDSKSCKYCHSRMCPVVITEPKSKRKSFFF